MYFWSAVYLSDATETMPVDMSADPMPDDGDLVDNSPSMETTEDLKPVTKTRSCDNIVATLDTVGTDMNLLQRRLSDPSIMTDSGLCGKDKDIEVAPGTDQVGLGMEEGVTGWTNEVNSGSTVNKQIVMEAAHEPGDTDSRAAVDDSAEDVHKVHDQEPNSENDAVEDDTSAAESLDVAVCSLSPVLQAISDRRIILKHSIDEDNPSLTKRSSSDAAIETSTDTLTDMMEQCSPGSGDSKPAVPAARGQQMDVTGSRGQQTDEDSKQAVTSDDEEGDARLSVLARGTDVSTSTTDISDSHVLGSLGTGLPAGYHKGSLSSPSVNGQILSLRLDNLLKLHIPDSTKLHDYSLSQV